MKIKFYMDVSVLETFYPADSTYIAPFGTQSSPENWRDNVQIGDLVDALDKYNCWNTATVIWTDTREPGTENCNMPMCRVGFRSYATDGDKSDKMGAYWGYSD